MKPDLSFKSTAKIESILEKLAKLESQNQDPEIGISDFIFDDPDAYDPLLNAIFQNKYVAEHYDGETIVDLLHHSYYRSKPKNGAEYLQAFKDIFQHTKNDWVALIPLDFNRPFRQLKAFRPLRIGHCLLTRPFQNARTLALFLDNHFGVATIDEPLLDHQLRQTGKFLNSVPVLIFAIHGSQLVSQLASQNTLQLFRQLHNLYTANFGERSTLVSVYQQMHPISHAFLLDKTSGEIYRYPLREGSKLLTRFDARQTRRFIKGDFAALLDLLDQKSIKNKLTKRVLQALYFFSKGFNEQDSVSRFLFYVISAEALFSRDRDTPISSTLADYTSLMSATSKQRLLMHHRLRRIYQLRSSIVHSGKSDVTKDDIGDTEAIVSRTLLKVLRSLLPPTAIESEDEFFDELRKLKLRLKSRLA